MIFLNNFGKKKVLKSLAVYYSRFFEVLYDFIFSYNLVKNQNNTMYLVYYTTFIENNLFENF